MSPGLTSPIASRLRLSQVKRASAPQCLPSPPLPRVPLSGGQPVSIGRGLLVHIATGPLLQVASGIYKSRIGRRVGALIRLAGVAGGHHGTCGACVLLQSHMRNIRSVALDGRRREKSGPRVCRAPCLTLPSSPRLAPLPGRSANRRRSSGSSGGQMTGPTSPGLAKREKGDKVKLPKCFSSRLLYVPLCMSS